MKNFKRGVGTFMRIAVLVTAFSTAIIGLALADQATAAIKSATNIAPQELRSALRVLAADRQLQILYATDTVANRSTAGAVGELTVDEALTQLLGGTGLVFRYIDRNTITILRREEGESPQESGASARPPAAAARTTADDEIVVTGSRLPLTETESPYSTTILDNRRISKSGARDMAHLLSQVPQISLSLAAAQATNGWFGASPVQLRGLPIGSTLVLVNGRRTAPSGIGAFNNFFDVKNIPLSAVERVEIVATGASAIYGSDAIAGVVNVILKDERDGLDVSGNFSSASPLQDRRVAAAFGWSNASTSVGLVLNAEDSSGLHVYDRRMTADTDYRGYGGPDLRSTRCTPGTVYAVPGTGNLPGLNAARAGVPAGSTGTGLTPASFTATAGQTNACSVYSGASLMPESDRYGVIASVKHELPRDIVLRADYMRSEQRSVFDSSKPGITGSTNLVPADNPYNPFGAPVLIDFALNELDSPRSGADNQFERALISGDIGLFGSWRADVGAWRTEDNLQAQVKGSVSSALTRTALTGTTAATALNPFIDSRNGSGNSPQLLASLRFDQPTQNFRSKATQYDISFKGNLIELPAGHVRLVVGGESRDEAIWTQTLASATMLAPFVDASRDSTAIFGETYVPVLRDSAVGTLGITLAVRRDRYSDFGSRTTPQYAFSWAPTEAILVRGSASRSFRAPQLTRLFQPRQFFEAIIVDPARGNVSTLYEVITGGNPNLQPESGRAANLGVLLRPTGGFDVSLDYWRVELDRRATVVNSSVFLQNESLFPDRVTRAAPSAEDLALGRPGAVLRIDASAANLGGVEVSGFDFSTSWKISAWGGAVRATAAGTYFTKYDAFVLPNTPVTDRLGVATSDGFSPRFKAVARVGFEKGSCEFDAAVNHTSEYRDYAVPGLPARDVSAYSTLDLSASLDVLAKTNVRVGATNVTDKEPPYANSDLGYDPRLTSPIGRTFYVALTHEFF